MARTSIEPEITAYEPLYAGGNAGEWRLDTWLRPGIVVSLPEDDAPVMTIARTSSAPAPLRFEHLSLSLAEVELLAATLRRALRFHKRQSAAAPAEIAAAAAAD